MHGSDDLNHKVADFCAQQYNVLANCMDMDKMCPQCVRRHMATLMVVNELMNSEGDITVEMVNNICLQLRNDVLLIFNEGLVEEIEDQRQM